MAASGIAASSACAANSRSQKLLDVRDAAQACELRRQFEGLGDEALILAIEEETDLAKRLNVAFVGQLHHAARLGSPSAIRRKGKVWQRGRRERHPSDQRAAVEEEIELADRQPDWRVAFASPQCGEPAALSGPR